MPAITPARVVMAFTALLVLYFGATAAGNAIDSYRLDRERATLERDIARLQREHEQLVGLQAYLESDEYIETVARRELGLVMPGEPAVVVVSPQRVVPGTFRGEEGAGNRWWERLLAP